MRLVFEYNRRHGGAIGRFVKVPQLFQKVVELSFRECWTPPLLNAIQLTKISTELDNPLIEYDDELYRKSALGQQ